MTTSRLRPGGGLPCSRRQRVGLAAGLLLLAGGVVLALAVTRRPAWYQPATIDHARLPADRQALMGQLDEISAALNAHRSVQVTLNAGQVNRWLAARAELWPETDLDWDPCDQPQIDFLPGRIRVAALVRHAGLRAVASVVCRLSVDEQYVRVQCETARLGAVPVPLDWLARQWPGLADIRAEGRVARADQAWVLENEGVWSNGRKRYRIERLEIDAGHAVVTLRPLRSTP